MIKTFQDSFRRNPFFWPMILFSLSAFLYSFVSEINSFIWLVATLVFGLSYYFLPKLFPFGVIFALLFFAWYRLAINSESDKQFRFLTEYHQKIIEIKGVVHSIDSLDMQQAFDLKRKISFIVEITHENIFYSNYIKVDVLEEKFPEILPGQEVTVTGKYLVPFELTIPNTFDSQKYYRSKKWIGVLQVKSWDAVEVTGEHFTYRKWLHQIRKSLYQNLKYNLSDLNAALVASFVLGYTADIDPDLLIDFQRWGIAHIFSVSGLHLGLISFWAWFISGFFTISLRKRTIFTIFIAFLYCVASGMSIATVRSFIMLCCFLSSYLFNRRSSLWNSFSIAFIILFLWDPQSVFSASFQLSFMAVAGILVTQEILSRRKIASGVELVEPENRFKILREKLISAIFYPLMISTATLGITAYHFQVISFGSVLLNLIIVPIFSVIMGMTFFYIPFLFIIPKWMAWPLEKTCDFFVELPGWLAGGSGLYTFVQSPAPWLIFLLFVVFCLLSIPKFSIKKSVAIYFIYFLIAKAILLFQGEPPKDRFVMLNVAKASACLFQTKTGQNILFDCGTVTGFDRISPYLRGEGINTLRALVISHDNYDHFSCWPKIFKNFKVESVWRNQANEGISSDFGLLENHCKKQKIPMRSAYSGEQLELGANEFSANVLHPAQEYFSNKNDESMVVLLKTSWCEILFTGDAQKIYDSLTNTVLPLKTSPRILVFPHHGRNIKSAEKLLQWYQPDLILISGDRLSQDVSEVLSKINIPWMLTSEKGTIEVQSDLTVKNYLAGRWHKVVEKK